ncbi:MAG: YggS family pyridoxal phosphate-dependent enzyme [Bacilli bacterium]|nr:YggS family pyridoxal phosphate-dependent enzyme [Bacilli bacterium]
MVRPDLKEFLKSIPEGITVVAATKYIGPEDMIILQQNGIDNFGENRVDSFLFKKASLMGYDNIRWHFIGHLQRNKAKKVINEIDCLHSLDSLELAALINEMRKTPLDTFIEVSINLEENKNGVPYYDVENFIKEVTKYPNIHLVGLMMMARQNSKNPYLEFNLLRELRDELEKKLDIKLPYLSMGMSDDYLDAIKAGATHIRLGRILFKE